MCLRQVNLPSEIYKAILIELKQCLVDFDLKKFRRKKILKSIRPVSATIFEAASGSVYVLMGSDTLVRFKVGAFTVVIVFHCVRVFCCA